MSDLNAHLGIFLGFLFGIMGSSFATIKASKFVTLSLDFKHSIPIIQAGVLAIYTIIITTMSAVKLDSIDPNKILSAGLVNGFACLFSGLAIGFICDKVKEYSRGLVIALIFAESLALYGLIISLVILAHE
jgi:V-type H+-transporting ATPase proteolipid subunit